MELKEKIESAWLNRDLLSNREYIEAINEVINLLDKGDLRVAEKNNSNWMVNEWIKKALHFSTLDLVPSGDKAILNSLFDLNKEAIASTLLPFVNLSTGTPPNHLRIIENGKKNNSFLPRKFVLSEVTDLKKSPM